MELLLNLVKGAETISLKELSKFKSNELKGLSRNTQKLQNAIKSEGFIAPILVWEEGKYILDGAGRLMALKQLHTDGFELIEIPIIKISATSLENAKKIVMMINSQYGEISIDNVRSFLKDFNEYDITGLISNVQISTLDIRELLQKNNDIILDNLGNYRDDVLARTKQEFEPLLAIKDNTLSFTRFEIIARYETLEKLQTIIRNVKEREGFSIQGEVIDYLVDNELSHLIKVKN
jgi:ParB-like nuclease domain